MILDCLVSSRITAIHNNIVKNPNWSFTSVAEATVEKLQVLLRSYLSGTRALDGTTGASSSRARCLPSFQPSMYVDLSRYNAVLSSLNLRASVQSGYQLPQSSKDYASEIF